MTAELAATFFTANYGQELALSMERNQSEVMVLSFGEYFGILTDKSRNNPRLQATLHALLAHTSFGRYWSGTVSPNVSTPWVVPTAQGAVNALAITRTLNAVGMAGIRSRIQVDGRGVAWIVLTGRAGLRGPALTGTRYLASNPIMIRLGLGIQSLSGIAKGGFMLGVIVSSGIETLDFLFNDEKTLFDLVGGIGVEAVKAGLATLIGYAAATGVALFSGLAIAPLAVMAAVVFFSSAALNIADANYQLKSKVLEILKRVPHNAAQGMYKIDEKASGWIKHTRQAVQSRTERLEKSIGTELANWLCPICRRYYK